MASASRLQLTLSRFSEIEWYLRAMLERILPFGRGVMTSKERIKRAIEFKCPDRIPHRFYDDITIVNTAPRSWQPPEGFFPYVHPYDVNFGGWRWKKRRSTGWLKEDRIAVDEFGVVWRASAVASMGEPVKGPLQDGWHLLDSYHLPDMSDPERLRPFKRLLRLVNPNRYLLGGDLTALGPWELFRHLRGFENAVTDLIDHPREVTRLMDTITGMFMDSVQNFSESGVDGFCLLDDWGTQHNSFISPHHFREFFMPGYRMIIDRCHDLGIHCGIHSCGNIRPLVPLIIEAGFDFLELNSPSMCGLEWLSEHAAGKICLFCSMDTQTAYPSNDPDIMESFMKEMIRLLATPDGGLCLWPNSNPYDIGVGASTIRAERRIYKKYRGYSLDDDRHN
jgi:hypothetical protein